MKLYQAISQLEREASEQAGRIREALDVGRMRCQLVGVREVARRAGVYGEKLAKVLDDANLYKDRNTVERGFEHLKQWRGIASRYDKHALIYLATIVLNHRIRI